MDRRTSMDRRTFLLSAAGALSLSFARRWAKLEGSEIPETVAVGVDPRIELFGVILLLGGFRGFAGHTPLTGLSFPYRDEVEARFGALRDHPVVGQYDRMAERGFWLTHPPSAMLHLTPPPELAERIPVNDFTVRMAGGRESLDAFLTQARDFAEASNFMAWFQEQEPFHRELAGRYRDRMAWDYLQDLLDYYGDRRERYTLILAPLAHPGGFGPRVVRPDGLHDAFAVVGPHEWENGQLDFGPEPAMRRLFWHEFSHAHVNHLTDRHVPDLLEAMEILQGHLRDEVEAFVPWEVHVSDWVSEHVVRAVTTRLTHLRIGPEEGDEVLRLELAQFPHVDRISHLLLEYEADRRSHPTLESFFPRIVQEFGRIAGGMADSPSPG